jgi:hypothetical protein
MIQGSDLPWRWEHAGSVSDKRSFGIAAIWEVPPLAFDLRWILAWRDLR